MWISERRCRLFPDLAMQEIDVLEAKRRLDQPTPPRLIDVREPDEWALCHIEGAELLPLSQWPDVTGQKLTNPDEAILVYCHHGGRSARATQFLMRQGFTNVTNVAGGIDAWSLEIDPAVPRYE